MIRVLFVCHGNICRSPMAEFVLRDMVEKRGLSHCVETASAATHTDVLGWPVHRGTRRKLETAGIACEGKTSRLVAREDYAAFDVIVAMDQANVQDLRRVFGGDPEGKVRKLLSFQGLSRDVADPWYTGDFEQTWQDVTGGCDALLESILREGRAEA